MTSNSASIITSQHLKSKPVSPMPRLKDRSGLSGNLIRERRDADNRLVSTQHQQIGENSDGPAPEPDLTRDEPVPPSRDGGEWNNGGLPGKGLPGGTQEPAALWIDRHGASEGHVTQVAKKKRDATSPLPIRCTSAQRPTPVRNG